ncbi:hypothetical protein D3C76_1635440 [compost metagenome]
MLATQLQTAVLDAAPWIEQHRLPLVDTDLNPTLGNPHKGLVTLLRDAEARADDLHPAVTGANQKGPRRIMADLEPRLATQQTHPSLPVTQLDLHSSVGIELQL